MLNLEYYFDKYEDNFSKSDKRIATYLIESYDAILNSSVEEIAQATQTSGATIVRFCRKIGFKGFVDFKYQLDHKSLFVIEKEQNISNVDNIDDIKKKVIQYSINLMQEFYNAIDSDELERACNALISAKRIVIYAEGGSASMAHYAKSSLVNTGLYCNVETDPTLQVTSAEYLNSTDVAIGITHSGRITTTIDALSIAKRNKATTIAITGAHGTPVCQYSDIVLSCDVKHPFDLSDFHGSRLEEFCILTILQISSFLKTHREVSDVSRRVSETAETKRRIPMEASLSKNEVEPQEK